MVSLTSSVRDAPFDAIDIPLLFFSFVLCSYRAMRETKEQKASLFFDTIPKARVKVCIQYW